MFAVAKGDINMIKVLLLNKSLNINAIDHQSGVSSFWLACLYGYGEIMILLAEEGADIYVTNKSCINVMHLAIMKNYTFIVKMLIDSGFPVDTMTA